MNSRVSRITELLQDQVALRIACLDLFGFGNGTFHAFRPFGQHQIGTQCLKQFAAFYAHGFRHGQRQFITASGGDVGQSYPGVTAGRFHQLDIFGQNTAFFGIPNHICTNTAFDAEAWIA